MICRSGSVLQHILRLQNCERVGRELLGQITSCILLPKNGLLKKWQIEGKIEIRELLGQNVFSWQDGTRRRRGV